MFNFFHSIVGKIAIGLSGVALFFSGVTSTPHPVTQPVTQNGSHSVGITQKIDQQEDKEFITSGHSLFVNTVSPKKALTGASETKLDLNFLAQVVVKLQCDNEWGSGTLIKRDGNTVTIFTNKHVVGSSNTCKVYATTLSSNSPPALKWKATVSSVDPTADLAILTIKDFPLSYPVLRDQSRFCNILEYRPGQHMTIIGYPATVGGDPVESTINISSGDISGTAGGGLITKTTAFIDSGSSGGAAFSDENCYFGIPTAIFYRANVNELSNLGEVINILSVLNMATFLFPDTQTGSVFVGLKAGNIADYTPEQTKQTPDPTPVLTEDPALKIAKCQAQAQSVKDDLKTFATLVANAALFGTPYVVHVVPGAPAGSMSEKDFLVPALNMAASSYLSLVNQHNLLVKHLFDKPLLADEIAALPKPLQEALATGDRSNIEMQLKLINTEMSQGLIQVENTMKFIVSTSAERVYNKTYSDCLNQ